MKSFFLKIGVFVLGFITVVILPILWVSRYDNIDKETADNHNIVTLQTKSSYDSLALLFVGNSYGYSSIDTKYLDSLGLASFNLGIATAGVQFYELVIKDYFDRITTPPQKVLLLVTPMTFSNQSDNFSAYPVHRYLEQELSNIEVALQYKKLDELDLLYKKSLSKAFVNLTSPKTTKETGKERFNNKGYLPSGGMVDENIIAKEEHLYLDLKDNMLDTSKVTSLLALAHYLQQKGSEVIFYELPTHLGASYFSADYLAAYQKSLLRLRQEFELLSIDPRLFSADNYRNIDHMNSSGAKIATKTLVNLLQRLPQ